MNLTSDDNISCLRIPPPVKIKNSVSSDCKYLISIGLFISTNENSLKSRFLLPRLHKLDILYLIYMSIIDHQEYKDSMEYNDNSKNDFSLH